ncbi:MAG: hypothetical protein M3316_00730 [Actinomycetota bacterium]|nr:hypothetical protein [Actinomycetota bacterium]
MGVLSLIAGSAEVAGAQTVEGGGSAAQTADTPILKARVEEQDAMLEEQIGEISAVSAELEETQSQVFNAQRRTTELAEQTRPLERELDVRQEAFEAARAGYEEKARAVYKGSELEGPSVLLDGLLGSTGSSARLADSRVAEILLEGQESLEAYRESERILRNTWRQISQKKRDYKEALREKRVRTAELRREAKLD